VLGCSLRSQGIDNVRNTLTVTPFFNNGTGPHHSLGSSYRLVRDTPAAQFKYRCLLGDDQTDPSEDTVHLISVLTWVRFSSTPDFVDMVSTETDVGLHPHLS
jgi:hypothetical protein